MHFVIGDIHGEIRKLNELLKIIFSMDKNPSLVFVGDYLDKGENSWATMECLNHLNKQYSCTFLEGNHEFYWQRLAKDTPEVESYLEKYGADTTVSSVEQGSDIYKVKQMLLEAFPDLWKCMKAYHVLGEFLIVHSGIPPARYQTRLEDIPRQEFLFNRYSFLAHSERYFGKIVIFGHTGFYEPYWDGCKIGIDTAACYLESQPLTAFCTDNKAFMDSTGRQYTLDSLPLDQCPVIPRVKPWRARSKLAII